MATKKEIEQVPMWPELDHPLRWAAIYAATIVLSLLLSHAGAAGWLPW